MQILIMNNVGEVSGGDGSGPTVATPLPTHAAGEQYGVGDWPKPIGRPIHSIPLSGIGVTPFGGG